MQMQNQDFRKFKIKENMKELRLTKLLEQYKHKIKIGEEEKAICVK